MAYIASRPGKPYEVREAHVGARGPRSRTLVTFRVLDDAVLDRAEERAGHAFNRTELRRAARRAGAEVLPGTADAAAGVLLREIAMGRTPTPARERLLAAAVGRARASRDDDHLRAAGEWSAATSEERAAALVDLLGLADALPVRGRKRRLRFPRLESAA